MRETGIPIVDLGQRLPLRFRFSSGAGRAVFDGCLLICDESILCELPCRSLSGFDTVTVSTAADESADMSGFCIGTSACGAGLRLYDRYGERNDPTSNQTLTARLLPSDGTVPGALHFSCELRIDGMPVTEDPGLTPIGVYARGLCFLLCDDQPFLFRIGGARQPDCASSSMTGGGIRRFIPENRSEKPSCWRSYVGTGL